MLKTKFRNWVNAEVAKELDKVRFPNLPLKMRIGIFMLMTSFITGYGISTLIVFIFKARNQLATGIAIGSALYVVCWVLGTIGLGLAGRDSIKYPIYFFAKGLKKLFPKYFEKQYPGEL